MQIEKEICMFQCSHVWIIEKSDPQVALDDWLCLTHIGREPSERNAQLYKIDHTLQNSMFVR